MRGARVFQRGQRNNHVCTYKFTRLQKHAWFLHEPFSRVCHIFLVLSVCESKIVTQFYKSNATSALVAG